MSLPDYFYGNPRIHMSDEDWEDDDMMQNALEAAEEYAGEKNEKNEEEEGQ